MQNDHEALSTVVDGELDVRDNQTLPNIAANDSSRATWARYHLIGDVLRDVLTEIAPTSFSERLVREIDREPTMLISRRARRPWLKPAAGFAIAASVAVLAVVGVQQMDPRHLSAASTTVATAVEAARQAPPIDHAIVVSEPQLVETTEIINPAPGSLQTQRRLNGYLVKFNEQRSSLGVPGVNPYVRIVGFESE